MLINLKKMGLATLGYLGDAAHRRFAATIIVLAATHFVGKALAPDDVANALDLLVGGIGGAWSRNTPKLDATYGG